ncbi:hypothetical protein RHECNPAF_12210085 [Rhizobium etli CNPAF512]|nr:hypothetical protein RHECNPAF_12210085 [Rhizobium etli CNPAF512]
MTMGSLETDCYTDIESNLNFFVRPYCSSHRVPASFAQCSIRASALQADRFLAPCWATACVTCNRGTTSGSRLAHIS